MSCRNCGSDWTTPKGKDCNRCPHCDKLQRCLARKQGRLPAEISKTCRLCGITFTVKPTSQHATVCRRKECQATLRAEKACRHRKLKALGLASTQESKQPLKTCKREGCAALVKNNKHDYCSKACFFSARTSGRHAWDTTNIKKANWHRSGWYSSAPSVRLMRRIRKAHLSILRVAGGLERQACKELNRPTCEQCGQPCNDGASRFCSYACSKSWRGAKPCQVCGANVPECSAHGQSYCDTCRRAAKRRYRKQYKRELGSHRKKVRKGGGFWNSSVRRSVVLAGDRYRCYLCRRKCSKTFRYNDPLAATVDMVVPASKGGDWDYYNLRCACRQCNSRKSDRLMGQLTLRMGS